MLFRWKIILTGRWFAPHPMLRSQNIPSILSCAAFLWLALLAAVVADDLVDSKLEPFLEANCFDCHDDETSKGDLNLYDLEFEPDNPGNFRLWERVFDRVESGEMPPKKKARPDAKQQAAFLKNLGAPLLAADRKDRAERGRVNVRRLTRREYEHTVQDLLGIDIPLQELLPEDPATEGFETVAEGQQLSHFNLARYLESADLALAEAFKRSVEGEEKFSRKIPALKIGKAGSGRGNFRGLETPSENLAIAWPIRQQFYGRIPASRVPESGWYQVTLKNVHAINPKQGAIWGTLRSGACFSNEPMLYPVGIVEAIKGRRDMVFEAWIREGHMLELKPNEATLKRAPSGATGGQVSYKGRNVRKEGYQGIGLTGIEIERVYPNAARWELRNRLLGKLPKADALKLLKSDTRPEHLLRKTIQQFAERAFRRPVTNEQISPYVKLALAEIDRLGEKPADGLKAAYRAILCSPRFLTFVEEPGGLDDHALASRMSYMFWNSMPDAQLRALADAGKLMDYKVRHQQVERLLADPKADRFITSFTDQWLDLKDINFTSPDLRLYRTFDSVVQQSMLDETRAFFKEIIRTDASITNVIQSDFTMLNERLARFYGFENLAIKPGAGLQRVDLGNSPRGGLVTHGSVLKVTANGTTTSPVVRGIWVAERLLGLHIPPPPPGIPAVEPDVRGAVSIRDQLAKHSNNASCAACHDKIDPAGFVLETFSPVGLWRKKYGDRKNSAKVDPSGTTPDGVAFANIEQWKAIYVKRPDTLTESFAEHLITYATGAAPRFSDRHDIEKIVELARAKGYGMKRIIHAV
ncbi:MAG: hypothetical protein ACI8XO_005175, partial [Verrucomicrobiales bacterium]